MIGLNFSGCTVCLVHVSCFNKIVLLIVLLVTLGFSVGAVARASKTRCFFTKPCIAWADCFCEALKFTTIKSYVDVGWAFDPHDCLTIPKFREKTAAASDTGSSSCILSLQYTALSWFGMWWELQLFESVHSMTKCFSKLSVQCSQPPYCGQQECPLMEQHQLLRHQHYTLQFFWKW